MIKKSTLDNIQKFAKDNTKTSLSKDEMTYFEILGTRVNRTMNKAKREANRFRVNAKRHEEETEELAGYMIDYVTDLVDNEHLSEDEAFAKAEEDFKVENPENPLISDPRYESWLNYHESMDPSIQEAIGLIYLSRLFIGFVIGAVLGIFGQIYYDDSIIGRVFFIMVALGIVLGISLGMAGNARITLKHQK